MLSDEQCTVDDNSRHYTRVTDLFQVILGDHFHWGYFKHPDAALGEAQEALIELMLSSVHITEDTSVLDVGCGIGGTVFYLSERYGCRTVGLTNNTRGLEVAKARFLKSGVLHPKVDFRFGDALNNGFESDSFDVVIMIETTDLIPDKHAVLRECHRTLKPGGMLALCDNMSSARQLTLGDMFKYHRSIAALKRTFGFGEYISLSGYRQLAEKAGFREIRCADLGPNMFPTIGRVIGSIESNRHRMAANPDEVNDFLTAWTFTTYLWENGFSTYGFLRAVK
jgi:27-O-demethylrifamycin SV methyltransferase